MALNTMLFDAKLSFEWSSSFCRKMGIQSKELELRTDRKQSGLQSPLMSGGALQIPQKSCEGVLVVLHMKILVYTEFVF
jgi:hypothetical protein